LAFLVEKTTILKPAMSLFSTRIRIFFSPFHGYKNTTELFTLQRGIKEQVWLLGAYVYYSTKEMKKTNNNKK
jgi:hypothetical protein